ncbi:normal mucosa of esophagus-specific gene 1 protein [Narcine bancroftii]|uniref:normal mucosa of esophagus-specific gene 1 protein n=1 Tax=Narcine bancroftii TaxID=1343680 RepID=UPI0038315F72
MDVLGRMACFLTAQLLPHLCPSGPSTATTPAVTVVAGRDARTPHLHPTHPVCGRDRHDSTRKPERWEWRRQRHPGFGLSQRSSVSMKFLSLLRKRKELIPLVALMTTAATFGTGTCIYFLATKSDVIINKSHNPTPWENVDPNKPQKLLTITQKWEPVDELQMVKRYTK